MELDEVNEIMQEASHTPDPQQLITLQRNLDIFDEQQTPSSGSESSDGLMATNDTTIKRLARYADEASSNSNDMTWEEMMADSDPYFTGSADTSGGCISDASED